MLLVAAYHIHDLFYSFKFFTKCEAVWKLQVSSQSEVVPHGQLLIVGCGQLEHIASVSNVPFTDFINRSAIDVYVTLQCRYDINLLNVYITVFSIVEVCQVSNPY